MSQDWDLFLARSRWLLLPTTGIPLRPSRLDRDFTDGDRLIRSQGYHLAWVGFNVPGGTITFTNEPYLLVLIALTHMSSYRYMHVGNAIKEKEEDHNRVIRDR